MSKLVPSTFRSLLYSAHSLEDCGKVLSLHRYRPQADLDRSIVARTLAFPVNPSDVNQLQGVYPSLPEKTSAYATAAPAAVAGNEGVLEVVHVPDSLAGGAAPLRPGDWVVPLHANSGTWTDYRAFASPSEVVRVSGLDLLSAATVAVNGCTAHQLVNNFVDWARSSGNNWIVQNAGTSGVSKLVSQIARAGGVNTLSVIRDRPNFDEVARMLETRYGATRVVSESQFQDKAFRRDELPRLLGPGARVRLGLNSVGGKSSSSVARLLERHGTLVTYGGMAKQPVILPTSLLIFKQIVARGFWITGNIAADPQCKVDSLQEFMRLYREGHIVAPDSARDFECLQWDTQNDSDEDVLEMVRGAIAAKGKKQVVTLKW